MNSSVYIIAGPNGAGKTTFAREFLPNYADCKNFINADLIAQGVSPFSPEEVAFRAGRLMIEEINSYVKHGASFGFETTLSGRSYLNLIRDLTRRRYEVHFFFLWIPNVALALSRVRARVLEGGHDVPAVVVAADSTARFATFCCTIGLSATLGCCSITQAQHPLSWPLRNRAASI